MEISNAKKSNDNGSGNLILYAQRCELCDVSFLTSFKEEYHTIVSGYNAKSGTYLDTGKFPANHILNCQGEIVVTEYQLRTKELEELVDLLIEELEKKNPLSKVQSDIRYVARSYLLDYYAKS